MAARKSIGTKAVPMPDAWRQKISISMLTNRLQDHVKGECDLSQTQVAAARILLGKVAPDLQAVQHSGDAENPILHDVQIRPQLSRAEWEKRHVLKR